MQTAWPYPIGNYCNIIILLLFLIINLYSINEYRFIDVVL